VLFRLLLLVGGVGVVVGVVDGLIGGGGDVVICVVVGGDGSLLFSYL